MTNEKHVTNLFGEICITKTLDSSYKVVTKLYETDVNTYLLSDKLLITASYLCDGLKKQVKDETEDLLELLHSQRQGQERISRGRVNKWNDAYDDPVTCLEKAQEVETPPLGDMTKEDYFLELVVNQQGNHIQRKSISKKMWKYWDKRYSLFSRYSVAAGRSTLLDEEGWYSITPEVLALHQAHKCRKILLASRRAGAGAAGNAHQPLLGIEPFCGCGGNAIQLARFCERVLAIECSLPRLLMAQHNAGVYGLGNITFEERDFYRYAPEISGDILVFSPPWGGPAYALEEAFDVLASMNGETGKDAVSLADLINIALDVATERAGVVAIFLPRNLNLTQLVSIIPDGCVWELERNFVNRDFKGVTLYARPKPNPADPHVKLPGAAAAPQNPAAAVFSVGSVSYGLPPPPVQEAAGGAAAGAAAVLGEANQRPRRVRTQLYHPRSQQQQQGGGGGGFYPEQRHPNQQRGLEGFDHPPPVLPMHQQYPPPSYYQQQQQQQQQQQYSHRQGQGQGYGYGYPPAPAPGTGTGSGFVGRSCSGNYNNNNRYGGGDYPHTNAAFGAGAGRGGYRQDHPAYRSFDAAANAPPPLPSLQPPQVLSPPQKPAPPPLSPAADAHPLQLPEPIPSIPAANRIPCADSESLSESALAAAAMGAQFGAASLTVIPSSASGFGVNLANLGQMVGVFAPPPSGSALSPAASFGGHGSITEKALAAMAAASTAGLTPSLDSTPPVSQEVLNQLAVMAEALSINNFAASDASALPPPE